MDLPILMLPTALSLERQKRRKVGDVAPLRSEESQREYLDAAFKGLRARFARQIPKFSSDPSALRPEEVLVLKLRGDIQNLAVALSKFVGTEIFFNYVPDEDAQTLDKTLTSSPVDAVIYVASADQHSLNQLYKFWRHYNFVNSPIHGAAPIRDLFKHIDEIRYWNFEDRLRQNGVLEYFSEELASDEELIAFEIELWFRDKSVKRAQIELHWEALIADIGGTIVARSCIPEIRYHALLVRVPRSAVHSILKFPELSQIATDATVQVFQDVGQSIGREVDREADESLGLDAIGEFNSSRPPAVAVFDTLVAANHPALADHVRVFDPDDWSEFVPVKSREHGTGMVSIVIHGDLKVKSKIIDRPVVLVPILKPTSHHDEAFPDDKLMVDLLHKRVAELKGTADGESIRVICLSIGDLRTRLDRNISKLARIVDYLSWKYSLLFIISAGNAECNFILQHGVDFSSASPDALVNASIEASKLDRANRRIISPADSINGLTVGSIYKDGDRQDLPSNFRLLSSLGSIPAPYSREGYGFRRSLKPELAIAGGRIAFRESIPSGNIRAVKIGRPGQQVAHPDGKYTNSRGTSNAAALVSHYANFGASILDDLRNEHSYDIDSKHEAVLLKALIAHAARFEPVRDSLVKHGLSRELADEVASFSVGYGEFSAECFAKCSDNRAILFGTGELSMDRAFEYEVPMPSEVVGSTAPRRVAMTLAYFSPVNPRDHLYRCAKLNINIAAEHLRSVAGVLAPEVKRDRAARGTLQHLVFDGNLAAASDTQRLKVNISCRSEAGLASNEKIAYGLVISLECSQEVNLNVYQHVAAALSRINVRSPVTAPQAVGNP